MEILEKNTGGVFIINHRIAENTQYFDNNPPPRGGNNTAGNEDGQGEDL